MDDKLTDRQKGALVDYWAATTPAEERAAYARMMALGLRDAYAPACYPSLPSSPPPLDCALQFGDDVAKQWIRAHYCGGEESRFGTLGTPGGLAALIATKLRAEGWRRV